MLNYLGLVCYKTSTERTIRHSRPLLEKHNRNREIFHLLNTAIANMAYCRYKTYQYYALVSKTGGTALPICLPPFLSAV